MTSRFDPSSFTYGCELEWGDVLRSLEIPAEMGSWDYSETVLVNRRSPYEGRASDPQGIDPPVGGEINTRPTRGWEASVERVLSLARFFAENGSPPTVSCMQSLHVHVHVPGLCEDVTALKRLVRYISDNQKDCLDYIHKFEMDSTMSKNPGSIRLLKLSGGTPMPDWLAQNIIEKAESFQDFIALHCRGKAGNLADRPNMPLRYAINTYSLKHVRTVEFRFFRSTLDPEEMASCFRFVEAFIDAALNGGPSVKEILGFSESSEDSENVESLLGFFEAEIKGWKFPKLKWEPDLFAGWRKSKWPKSRGKKNRQFIQVR